MEYELEIPDFFPVMTYRGRFDEAKEYQLGDVMIDDDNCPFVYVTNETRAWWEPLCDIDISTSKSIRTHPTNCKCCGAILTSFKCEYCGAEY